MKAHLGHLTPVRRSAAVTAGAAAALLALVVALLRRAVFGGEALYERDIQFDWYPQVESFVRAVASGSFPLWDDTIAFGQPLLADPSAQILYPSTWLNLVVRPWTYYTVFVVTHLWLSSVGLYIAARRLDLRPAASLMAAAVWVTSGPLLSMVNLWHHFASACWIPWVFLAADRLAERRRLRDVPALAATSAGQLLAGSGDITALTQLLVVALAVMKAVKARRPSEVARVFALLAVAWAATLGFTAVQWLSTLDVVRRSDRWGLPDAVRTSWSLTPPALLQTIFPLFLQDLPLRPELQVVLFDATEPFLPSVYLGLTTLVFAAALNSGRRAVTIFLWGGTLTATVFALGRYTPVHAMTTRLLPILGVFRYPVKAMVIAAFCFALLAGLGMDALLDRSEHGRTWPRVVLATLLAVAAAVAVGTISSQMKESWAAAAPVAAQLSTSTVLAVLALLTVTISASFSPRPRQAAVLAAAAIAVIDLFLAHQSLNRTTPHALLAFTPPVLEAVRKEEHSRLYVYEYFQAPGKSEKYLGRHDPYILGNRSRQMPLVIAQVLSQRLYPAPPSAGRWGIDGSYDVDFRRLYPSYLSRMTARLRQVESTPDHLRLLRLGAVSHVVALHGAGLEDLIPAGTFPSLFPEPIRLYRVPAPLPRTYLVSGGRSAEDPAALDVVLDPSFDPTRELVLTEGPATPIDPAFIGTARMVERKADRVRIEAKLTGPGFLVSVDSFEPGWKVQVDGADAKPLRVNVAFRGVHLPAGEHVVEWVYRPTAVIAGAVISGDCVLALAVIFGMARLREQRAARQRSGGAASPA